MLCFPVDERSAQEEDKEVVKLPLGLDLDQLSQSTQAHLDLAEK